MALPVQKRLAMSEAQISADDGGQEHGGQEHGGQEQGGGRRAQGVADRRRRLVRAAAELLAERDDGAFSMPELAARAGLSLATPYNLFGSKAGVLARLLEVQMRGFQRDSDWMAGLAPAARILGVVERLVAVYARDPRFFRNLWKAFYGLAPGVHETMPASTASHLVEPLVAGLVADGALDRAVPPAEVAAALTRIFGTAFEEWAAKDWPVARLARELRWGFGLVFLGLLSADDRAALLTELDATR